MHRDKGETRKRILAAVGKVLTQSGMAEIGINSIARQAGVDKVLIYRYFGSLEELLETYAEESSFWPDSAELLGDQAGLKRPGGAREALSLMLVGQLNEIRRRKATQEILRWEVMEANVLTDYLKDNRDKQTSEILGGLSMAEKSSKDLEALVALINAGITHLVLLSKTSDKHLGIDLHSNFGWQRLSKLIRELVNGYLNAPDDNVRK